MTVRVAFTNVARARPIVLTEHEIADLTGRAGRDVLPELIALSANRYEVRTLGQLMRALIDELARMTCPLCCSDEVAVTAEQMFMVNSGEHYCHSVKTQDGDAKATCLACRWTGIRKDLRPQGPARL